MTQRLRDKLKLFVIKQGPKAKEALSQAAGKSPRMIDRYLNGEAEPSQHTSYKLALACECSEEEALALSGAPHVAAKEPA